jgi:hypothetical protein
MLEMRKSFFIKTRSNPSLLVSFSLKLDSNTPFLKNIHNVSSRYNFLELKKTWPVAKSLGESYRFSYTIKPKVLTFL